MMATEPVVKSTRGGARPGSGRKKNVDMTAAYEALTKARAKREIHNSRIAEMEERKMAGELAEVADFSETLQKLASIIRAKFVALPSKTAPLLLGLETVQEIEAELTVAVWEALGELANNAGT